MTMDSLNHSRVSCGFGQGVRVIQNITNGGKENVP